MRWAIALVAALLVTLLVTSAASAADPYGDDDSSLWGRDPFGIEDPFGTADPFGIDDPWSRGSSRLPVLGTRQDSVLDLAPPTVTVPDIDTPWVPIPEIDTPMVPVPNLETRRVPVPEIETRMVFPQPLHPSGLDDLRQRWELERLVDRILQERGRAGIWWQRPRLDPPRGLYLTPVGATTPRCIILCHP